MMSGHGKGLPADVDAFIGRHVASVTALELLLDLARSPRPPRTAAEIAAGLGLRASHLEMELRGLTETGAVTQSDERPQRYRLGPSAEDPILQELARLYSRRRVTIIQAIFSHPHASGPPAEG